MDWLQPDLTNAGLEQSATTVQGLLTTNLVGPALGALGSIIAFTFIWNINDQVRQRIQAYKFEQVQKYENSQKDA